MVGILIKRDKVLKKEGNTILLEGCRSHQTMETIKRPKLTEKKRWYSQYKVRIAKVERDYDFLK